MLQSLPEEWPKNYVAFFRGRPKNYREASN